MGEDVITKDIIIEDPTGTLRLTMWRDTTDVKLSLQDSVLVKDIKINYNNYHKCLVGAVNYPQSMEVINLIFFTLDLSMRMIDKLIIILKS